MLPDNSHRLRMLNCFPHLASPSLLVIFTRPRPSWLRVLEPGAASTTHANLGPHRQLHHRCHTGVPLPWIIHSVQQYGDGLRCPSLHILQHPCGLSACSRTVHISPRPVLVRQAWHGLQLYPISMACVCSSSKLLHYIFDCVHAQANLHVDVRISTRLSSHR